MTVAKPDKAARAKMRRDGASPEVTVDVVIEEAAGSYNVYEFDARRGRVRLTGTVLEDKTSSLQSGSVTGALGKDGLPLPAIVIVSLPTFPGCLVEARVIGVLTAGDGRRWVVGIPAADTARTHIRSADDLTQTERIAVAEMAGGAEAAAWMPADASWLVVRQAREAFWEQKARAETAVRYGAAWKATAPAPHPHGRGEAEPHTWAEYLIPLLPARFQRYVEEMLLPDERILFFAERPEFTTPGRVAVFRRQKERHGLLVVTNRQVLTMLDSLPPDSTLVDWGYVAKATAVERVQSAWVEHRESSVEFRMSLAAAGGVEHSSLLFPAEHASALQEGVQLLKAFTQPAARTVAPLYFGAPEGRTAGDRAGLLAKYPHLERLVSQAGQEDVLAAAAARGPEGRGLGPALVVTPTQLIVFTGARSEKDRVEGASVPIDAVSSVEVLQSVISCRFEAFMPRGERIDRVSLRYDYPDSPAFVLAFITVRHLMGRPLPSAK